MRGIGSLLGLHQVEVDIDVVVAILPEVRTGIESLTMFVMHSSWLELSFKLSKRGPFFDFSKIHHYVTPVWSEASL